MTEGTPPPLPAPPADRGGNFWSRRSRRGKILIVVGALLLLFAIIGALSDPSDDTDEAAATEQVTTQDSPPATTEGEREEAEPEDEPEEPVAQAPRPIVLRGSGAKVETVNLVADSPAVVASVHRGSSNFVLELIAPGTQELLVNEIGNYSGEVAFANAAASQYRLRVQADGPWTVAITQPVPTPSAKPVPGTFSGRGPKVTKIRATDDLQPIVTSQHGGQSNFVVYLIGYGDTSGQELVVNEIGNYSGETVVTNMPSGNYLLAVQADGPWTVQFSP